jgi:enoyl-CoA hydratase/carnithine racemase
MVMNAPLLVDIRYRVATLTLNRPDKLNAINYETVDLLLRALDELESDPGVRALIVTGYAFGGGCEITEAVPLAIASDRALFAKPEIRLGMPPTFGGTQRLPRLSGRKRSLQLLLTGERFSAARALDLGLVNSVVPHDDLMSAARELAACIASQSSLAVTAILTAVTRGLNVAIDEGLQFEAEQFASLVPSRDLREGLDAWIGRREPGFQGC